MSVSSVVLDLGFAWLSCGNTDANVKSTTLDNPGGYEKLKLPVQGSVQLCAEWI